MLRSPTSVLSELFGHRFVRLGFVMLFLWSTGCATYSDKMREAQREVTHGESEAALTVVNKKLKVDHNYQLPKDLGGDKTLLLLERGTLLQGLRDYKGASRDMGISDQHLEWLDIDSSTTADIAKWIYSGSAGGYRAPAYERLLLNIVNMINYLSVKDFQGARVEARRFQIMESYFLDGREEPLLPELLALGNYMAGISFEGSRNYQLATRYYGRAWHFGVRDAETRARLVALYRVSGYRSHEIAPESSGLHTLIEDAQSAGKLSAEQYRKEFIEGHLVAVGQTGLVPYKKAQRIPIGMAMSWSSGHPHHYSAHTHHHANNLMATGALKWINFPVLTYEGLSNNRGFTIAVDGRPLDPHLSTNVAHQIEAGWGRISGALMASAITRMVTRSIAGVAAREVTRGVSGSSNGKAALFGILAQILVEGTLVIADKPDTRSWTTLPAKIRIMRWKTLPGEHQVVVTIGDHVDRVSVMTRKKNLTVVNFSKFR